MTQVQVCKELGMSKSALQSWVNETRLDQQGFEPAEGTEGKAEQARMLRRFREVEQENEILRQATAYLSQVNLKPGQACPK